MPSIVIAEKPSQARDYQRAVGSRYGRVLTARGHLFELVSPEKVNPEWKTWSAIIMRPPSGFYPSEIKSDPRLKRMYQDIKEAAKGADTIYIATDPDREGEGIGGNILAALRRDIKWEGRVMRVLPLGTDDKSLQDAFANARPAHEFKSLLQSYAARSQADQIFNLSLTRSATVTFKPDGWKGVLSVGRVLTPTLGIVCRRERELAAFKPQTYYLPWIEVAGSAGQVRLTFNPGEAKRIFDPQTARTVAESGRTYRGPITVQKERKKQAPPPLFSMSKLQAEAARRKKWDVEKTASILQALYEKHQVATYPRSSEVSLPEAEIENAPAMMKGVLGLPFMSRVSWSGAAPVIRRKKGAFSDADLKGAAHYAIVPNINTADQWRTRWETMSADERALFEIIARRYLAAIGPDREYDSTKLSIEIDGRLFSVSGTVEQVVGWKEASGAGVSQEKEQPEDEAEDDAGALPPFQNGDPVEAENVGIAERVTTPPSRYNTATLAIAMIEAWRLVEEPAIREALKETEGIGTEATRSVIVTNLLKRNFIEKCDKGSAVRATDAGMQFFAILERAAPRLLDVGLTGEMELTLDRVKSGDTGARAAVERIVEVADTALQSMLAAKAGGAAIDATTKRAPTDRMKEAAKRKAQSEGKKAPPPGTLSDFDKCRAYLGPVPEREGSAPGDRQPTATQMAFAEKIAAAKKVDLPAEAKANGAALSAWIDRNKGDLPKREASQRSPAGGEGRQPSAKQIAFAESIAARKKVELPREAYTDRMRLSAWIDAQK